MILEPKQPNEELSKEKKKWVTPTVEVISETIQGGRNTHFHEASLISKGLAHGSAAAYFS